METVKTVKEWKPMLNEVLTSKREELLMMGYSRVTNEELWSCLYERVWQQNKNKRLHEVVQDVLHLKSSIYMNYLTLNAYQDDNLMASISALTNEEQN